MTTNLRKALYMTVPTIGALLAFYGLTTGEQAAAIGGVLTAAITFAYAASLATGNRFGDPSVRRALYVLISAGGALAVAFGASQPAATLWATLAANLAGGLLATLNVDPDEQTAAMLGDGGEAV